MRNQLQKVNSVAAMRSLLLFLSLTAFCPDQIRAEIADGSHAGAKRENITFIMGVDTDNKPPFYAPAEDYYRYNSQADIDYLQTGLRSLKAVRDYLESFPPKNGLPWGIINVVTHSSNTGIAIPVIEDETSSLISLQNNSGKNIIPPVPDSIVDRQTEIHIQGCGIGRRPEILESLSKLFGGNDRQRPVVRAPLHLVFYESVWDQGRIMRTDRYIVRDWFLIFPGNRIPDKSKLIEKFQQRYPEADIDWQQALTNLTPLDSKNIFYEEIPLSIPVLMPNKMLRTNSIRQIVRNSEIKNHVDSLGYKPEDFTWKVEKDAGPENGGHSRMIGEARLVKVYSGVYKTMGSGLYTRMRPDMNNKSYYASSKPSGS
jgi:hypothetical protein